ncbi:hypothetical protein HK101_006523, partial [Irineochytrium annulatum]
MRRFDAVPLTLGGLSSDMLTKAKLPRALLLGTSPPAWRRRPDSKRGQPPEEVHGISRPGTLGQTVPAHAGPPTSNQVPFVNEYPDGVSSRGQHECPDVRANDVDTAWSRLCATPQLQGANVAVRLGYRPAFMGRNGAGMCGFLRSIGEACVVRVELPDGSHRFTTFVWFLDPGFLRYLSFRMDPTALDNMKQVTWMLPSILTALGGADLERLGEEALLELVKQYDATVLKKKLQGLVQVMKTKVEIMAYRAQDARTAMGAGTALFFEAADTGETAPKTPVETPAATGANPDTVGKTRTATETPAMTVNAPAAPNIADKIPAAQKHAGETTTAPETAVEIAAALDTAAPDTTRIP